MRFVLVLILVMAAGCTADIRTEAGLAPTVAQTFTGLLPSRAKWKEEKSRYSGMEKTPICLVEVLFLSGPPAAFRRLGITATTPRLLPPAQRNALIAKVREDSSLRVLSSPRLTAFSGQQARLNIVRQVSLITDFHVVEKGKIICLEPVVEVFEEGISMVVLARVKPGGVLLEKFDVAVSRLLGVRECSALLATSEGSYKMSWCEPSFMAGGLARDSLPNEPMTPGATWLMPLVYRVVQPPSNARALAAHGEVQETYRNHFRPDAGGLCPLNRQVVALIGANVITMENEQEKAGN
jgi:hypothetical protein